MAAQMCAFPAVALMTRRTEVQQQMMLTNLSLIMSMSPGKLHHTHRLTLTFLHYTVFYRVHGFVLPLFSTLYLHI